MKISVLNLKETHKAIEACVEHRGEIITWSLTIYGRRTVEDENMFHEFNEFVETLPMAHQDKIFECYLRFKRELDGLYTSASLISDLNEIARELAYLLPLDTIKHWVRFNSSITIPDSFKREFVIDHDRKTTLSKTYLHEDYVELIVLTVAIKAMVPIWGDFMNRTRNAVNKNQKEYMAYQILNNSLFIESDAFIKMMAYVKETIDSDNMLSVILNGISSEDYPEFITAVTLVRKLSLVRPVFENNQTHLLTLIYKFIKQRDKPLEDPSVPHDIKRTVETEEGFSGHVSMLERYRIKQTVAIGDIAGIEHSVRDIRAVAQRLKPDINLAMLDMALEQTQVLAFERILDPQIILLQWVLKSVISPRSVSYINKEKLIELMAVVQTVLWSYGHRELAVLSTARLDRNRTEISLYELETKFPVDAETVKELDRLYLTRRISNRTADFKPVNQALMSIDRLTDDLIKVQWEATVPMDMLRSLYGKSCHTRSLLIHKNIRQILANLILQLATRRLT